MAEPVTGDELRRQRIAYAATVIVALVGGIVFVALGPDRSATSDLSVAARTPSTPSIAVSPVASTGPSTASTSAAATLPATTAPAQATTTVPVGALPQTDAKPTASGATFDADVAALWKAIVADDPAVGESFFFPRDAYLQVKAISDPAGDYQQRLLANFADDVHALHTQLGADAPSATLVGLDVPGADAVWVQPGSEYNKLPYWRVYGSTLRYRVGDTERTLPVTSLISWRGEWYVVHLGAIR